MLVAEDAVFGQAARLDVAVEQQDLSPGAGQSLGSVQTGWAGAYHGDEMLSSIAYAHSDPPEIPDCGSMRLIEFVTNFIITTDQGLYKFQLAQRKQKGPPEGVSIR